VEWKGIRNRKKRARMGSASRDFWLGRPDLILPIIVYIVVVYIVIVDYIV